MRRLARKVDKEIARRRASKGRRRRGRGRGDARVIAQPRAQNYPEHEQDY